MNTVDTLGHARIFEGISERGLEMLSSICREKDFARGDYVFREASVGQELYIVLSGKVRISRNVAGVGEDTLIMLSPGDAFGEMSMIDDFPRSADAIAHERCRLIIIEKDAMEDLMFVHKDLAFELLWNFVRTLSDRLRRTNDKLTFLSTSSKFE